jgi:hypothetical protein
LATSIQYCNRQWQKSLLLTDSQALVQDGIGQDQAQAGLDGVELFIHVVKNR